VFIPKRSILANIDDHVLFTKLTITDIQWGSLCKFKSNPYDSRSQLQKKKTASTASLLITSYLNISLLYKN